MSREKEFEPYGTDFLITAVFDEDWPHIEMECVTGDPENVLHFDVIDGPELIKEIHNALAWLWNEIGYVEAMEQPDWDRLVEVARMDKTQ